MLADMNRAVVAACLSAALAACGGRTGDERAVDAAADAPAEAAPDASDAGCTGFGCADAGFVCPASPPREGTGCASEGEGESCVYGPQVCRRECICERGSWVCAADNCASKCPAEMPQGKPCANGEVGLTCEYGRRCTITCTCKSIPEEDFWSCAGPPC
jgi:hypothetical protein